MTDTLVTLPDVESLVIRALKADPGLTGLGGRIYSMVPKQRTFPLARVYRYGGDPMFSGDPYWLDQPSFQVDVWADTRPVARDLAETMRAVISQRLTGVWPEGTLSSVHVTALVSSDDPTLTPAKPRYRFTATAITHPNRAVPSEQ